MDTDALTKFSRFEPEELCELYKNDPTQFDQLAAALISEACIGKTPEQTIRLRQTQWLIDGQLRKGKTPLQRMHIMEHIFYSQVFGDEGELAHLSQCWNELLGALQRFNQIGTERVMQMLRTADGADGNPHQIAHQKYQPTDLTTTDSSC